MAIRDLLLQFASEYPSAKKESLKGHPTAALMKLMASEIAECGVFDGRYSIRGSVGKGGWAEIPWIAAFDLEETDTLHHGLVEILIFSADMKSLFLSLNQGSVTYFDSHSRPETNRHLEENVEALLKEVEIGSLNKGRIDLGASSSVGRFLETGCICSKRYSIGSLPSETEIVSDLAKFRDIYSEAMEAERRLHLDTGIPGRRTPVPTEFFEERDAITAAKDVLGMLLCRRMPDGTVIRKRITETEAYTGEDDSAAHARFGRTERNSVLYEAGGKAYVYRCHMYWLLNITAGREGNPQCVLIRGVEGRDGPGKASELMGICKEMYGNPLDEEHGLWLERSPCDFEIVSRPRIGIGYATEKDREAPLNFRIKLR